MRWRTNRSASFKTYIHIMSLHMNYTYVTCVLCAMYLHCTIFVYSHYIHFYINEPRIYRMCVYLFGNKLCYAFSIALYIWMRWTSRPDETKTNGKPYEEGYRHTSKKKCIPRSHEYLIGLSSPKIRKKKQCALPPQTSQPMCAVCVCAYSTNR